ncbi:MAG: biopolymer transporter ExbD [Kiritimatiellales bacterium]
MKAWLEELVNEKAELQIAPLIDVVFLLLIYFMVSSTLIKSEADLSLALPGAVAQSEAVAIPDEQIIEVGENGAIIMNGRIYTAPDKSDLAELEYTLVRYAEASRMVNVPAAITIYADDEALHERVVDVLNACAGANIKNITFGAN